MQKTRSVLRAILWAIVLLAFPVASGIIVVVFKMNQIDIYLTQACFMFLSAIVPFVYMYKKKINAREVGLRKPEQGRRALFFIPLVLSELPLLLIGVDLKSITVVSALALFALAVGISEELYFRGIIIRLLKGNFSVRQTVVISALLFGIGHIAGILSGKSNVDVFLQIINAIVFGILTAEIAIMTKSIIPAIVWHFVFDFSNHITLAAGINAIVVIGIQELIMITYAYYLWGKISLNKKPIV